MYRNTEKLWKAIEMLIKVAENEENHGRRVEILEATQQLTTIHTDSLNDFKNANYVRSE